MRKVYRLRWGYGWNHKDLGWKIVYTIQPWKDWIRSKVDDYEDFLGMVYSELTYSDNEDLMDVPEEIVRDFCDELIDKKEENKYCLILEYTYLRSDDNE